MHRSLTTKPAHDTSLIESLLQPHAFSHPAANIQLIETHISWLILAGDYAYKIKKPVVLDFLNFGDLERRRFFCEKELRLNQPWAQDIYLGVVPITLEDGQARFGGPGEAIEFAVQMRRFDQALRLDQQLEAGNLTVADMRELAGNIAARHSAAQRIDATQRSRVLELTQQFMEDNLSALDGFVDARVVSQLREWTDKELAHSRSLLAQRFDGGFVRDCHGDLHLGNLVRLADGITTFDCIEFNTDFRQIDVICDIAFLIMDLVERKRHDLAAHFLNRYLEATGDYAGVAVLSLFFVYRCLVRAKVAVIRSQGREDAADRDEDINEACAYCDMAMRQATDRTPLLILMHGLSGSGKTFVSGQLMAALPAIRLRSDIERKRIFSLGENASSHSAVGGGIYTEEANRDVYERLFEMAGPILHAKHNVILDAAFLTEAQRAALVSVASECNCTTVIVEVTAPDDVLRERLQQRSRQRGEPSEADVAVLEHQLSTREPLTPAERRWTVICENPDTFDVAELVSQVKALT